jgi:prephenate dehydratase
MRPRVGYLGPAGTFSEEALLASAAQGSVEAVGLGSIYETVNALRESTVEWALVPVENSLDGSITVTLDLLAGDEEPALEIVGEALLGVRHSLIAKEEVELGEIDTVLSHPQVPGQCTRFLRAELPRAQILPASSTAEAVRLVVSGERRRMAALGTRLAADIYGAVVLREDVQDRSDNATRFLWLARAGENGDAPPLRARAAGGTTARGMAAGGTTARGMAAGALQAEARGTAAEDQRWRTSLVFWGAGADSPGWLVRCLDEFARREINLTKIESRPMRERLGHYMFFVDLQGSTGEAPVASAVAGLRGFCQEVRVLGSYPAADPLT